MDPENQIQNSKSQKYLEQDSQIQESSSQLKLYKHKENHPDYKGEDIDRNLIKGPVQDRSCTNFICLLIFAAYFTGIEFLSIFSYAKGDIFRLGMPYDTVGNQCGYSEGFELYHYIYFPFENDLSKFICVPMCPTNENDPYYQGESKGINNVYYELKWFEQNQTLPLYATFIQGQTCVPTDFALAQKLELLKKPESPTIRHFSDLRNSYPMLIGMVFLVILFGYIYLFLMRKWAVQMTWVCIILYMIFIISGGIMFWSQANQLGPYEGEQVTSEQKTEYQMFAIGFWIVAILSGIYLCLNWKKIKVGVTFLKCSVDYTRDQMQIFSFPLILFFFYIIFLIYWIYTAMCIYSSGTTIISEDKDQNIPLKGPYQHTEYDKTMQFFIVFHIIAYFWVSQLFVYYSEFIVASSTSMWYFFKNESGSKIGMPGNLKTSFLRGIKHAGSLIFAASVLIAIQIPKLILSIIHKCTQQERNNRHQQLVKEGKTTSQQCQCCVSLSYFYEYSVRYIQGSSLIQTAITGKPFIKAAHDSYYLKTRNFYYFDAMSGIGVMMIFIGKIFIVGFSTFIAYLIVRNVEDIQENSYSTTFPTLFVGISSYFVASICVSIYGTSSDSILQCYCVEEELFNELREIDQLKYPRNIPATLQQFFDKNNLTPQGKKKRKNKDNI